MLKFNIGPRFFAPNCVFWWSANQTESVKFLLDHPCCHGHKNW